MLDTLLDYEDRIVRVQNYIRENLDTDLSLSRLANEACFSRYHFHRVFSAMVGEPVKKYVRRLRLENAARLLVRTESTVLDIALSSGYETHESFSRAFKSQFGFSPREYRNNPLDGKNRDRVKALGYKIIITRNENQGVIMDINIKKMETLTVAAVRHVGAYTKCDPAWKTLMDDKVLQSKMNEKSVFLGVCYDDPDETEEEKIRYDACMVIDRDIQPGEGIQKMEIDGGEFASLVHKGSYSKLHDSYKALYGEWLPQSKREPQNAPCLEIYLNNPETVADEAELLTEILVPLK